MERRWNRKAVSIVSSVTVVMHLPISCVSSIAISCHTPAVSRQRDRRHASCSVQHTCLSSSVWAAAPGAMAVLAMWDSAYVSGTVTSQAIGFPLVQGRRVVPSGLLLLSSIRLTGSLTAGICARLIALHKMSLRWL